MEDLKPDETSIAGNWIRRSDGSMSYDEHESRIDWLINNRLEELATDVAMWTTLYKDPGDGRLWELSFPQSEMHLGGPRRLDAVNREDAIARYALADSSI